MAKLSEGIISRRLWLKYGIGHLACPNIYYYAFESDLLILRNSGTVVEYEIKLSVADWNNGLKKRQIINPNDKNKRQNQIYITEKYTTRHEYLTSGLGANMFYYVAPKEVLDNVEIPVWAGIIKVWTNTAANSCGSSIVKKAPFLHREKASSNLKEKILTSLYYKYWQHHAVKDINRIMRRTKWVI